MRGMKSLMTGAAIGAALVAVVVVAGPLAPPAGPVASTYKTLSEVEPRIPISGSTNIAQPGSYYLTQNIVAGSGVNAITVSASNVTIDLNGFTLDGAAGAGFRAITSGLGNFRNITVRNGVIRNFQKEAIDLSGCTSVRVERVACDTATGAGYGIITNNNASITDCTVNGYDAGIIVVDGSLVADCVVSASRVSGGVRTGIGCTIRNVTVRNSAGPGFTLGEGSTVLGCTSSSTSGDGFVVGSRCRVSDCTASSAGGHGFNSGDASVGVTFTRCTASNVAINGFQVYAGSFVTDCTTAETGSRSSYNGVPSSGVYVVGGGSSNHIEGNRFYRSEYPVAFGASTTYNAALRNVSTFCGNYLNQGAASGVGANVIAPVAVVAVPSGPWDNMAH